VKLRSFCAASLVLAVVVPGLASTPAPPTAEEQAAVIEGARSAALSFSDHLPDFICTQVTRRWVNRGRLESNLDLPQARYGRQPAKTLHLEGAGDWKLRDTLTIQLTYFGQKEQYKLLLVNGKETKQSYESVEGTTHYGDFGSILGLLFQASSQAKFAWDHWGSLNGQPVMVFSFVVDVAHSQWRIGYGAQEVVTALKGFAFIEPTQHAVLKLRVNAADIPKKFPVQRSGLELDYRMQTVGDHDFLLPLKAVDWTDTKSLLSKNEAEFRRYRKFSTDSKIDFDTPMPLPESQIKDGVPNNNP